MWKTIKILFFLIPTCICYLCDKPSLTSGLPQQANGDAVFDGAYSRSTARPTSLDPIFKTRVTQLKKVTF